MLFGDKETTHDVTHKKSSKAPEGAVAGAGGIAGALIGLGIPELEAKRYEGKIKEGNILISVHTANSSELGRAKDIFAQAKAQDICATGESASPKQRTSYKRDASRPVERPYVRSRAVLLISKSSFLRPMTHPQALAGCSSCDEMWHFVTN